MFARARHAANRLDEPRQALARHLVAAPSARRGIRVAGVPSRGENLNVKPSAKPTSRTTLERLLEILVRLAGEADDDVGRHATAPESPRAAWPRSRGSPRACSGAACA